MFCLATKTGTSRGCVTPTVVRTYSALSYTASVPIGTASAERLIVISGGAQGSGTSWSLTLNGAAPDVIYNGHPTNNTFFAIWKVPTGTTATLTSNTGSNPFAVYAIYGWSNYKVVQFNNYLADVTDGWSFTANPIPSNSILFGMWASNEDSSGFKPGYNFGVANKSEFYAGEVDAGSAYEVLTVGDSAKLITCGNAGKRQSFGFLSLTCSNAAI